MSYVLSKNGYPIGQLLPDRSYWAVKFNDGSWACEEDTTFDLQRGNRRLDWSLDIVTSGDWAKIVELWLFCPPSRTSPSGNTARLKISPSGTAFQMKVGHFQSFGGAGQSIAAQLIGKVDDIYTGNATCHIFDYMQSGLVPDWETNVFNNSWGTWQPGIAPIVKPNFDVLGLHFTDYRLPDNPGGCDGCGEKYIDAKYHGGG